MLAKLKEMREYRDLMQKEVAAVLQIKPQQYQRYESGENEIPIRHLRTLCIFYGVSADYLLDLPRGLRFPK